MVFEPEELKAVMPESDRKIRIEKFVYYLSLDPIYFETPYILVPDRSEEAYSLLVTALQDIGRAAVGTITLRNKGVSRGGACLRRRARPDNPPGRR